jgi:acyl-homoserine lactone acylase PvdQ
LQERVKSDYKAVTFKSGRYAVKWIKIILACGVVVFFIFAALYFSLPFLNNYKKTGELSVSGLKKPVKICRDEKQMAYIYAQNLEDALLAQGFVTAQDRLFSMQLTRMIAQGRISELAGSSARDLDIKMRTIGLHRIARRQAEILEPGTQSFFEAYVTGDPHLDPRILPGVWYPLGIITPEIRAVGVNIPGLPGMAMGRTSHISLAMTNNYGDMQDLYIETPCPEKPGYYLDNSRPVPFKTLKETLLIKDKDAPGGFRREVIEIRFTKRGPVVSDLFPELDSEKIITLRWAPVESMNPEIGLKDVITAKSVHGLHQVLKKIPMLCLNWVFADSQGNIGYRATGRIPIRSNKDGTFPYSVKNGTDNWEGWIPQDQMPANTNPDKNWLGTCDHKTIAHDFPFYYSSFFAPSYRYQRLKQLMEEPGSKSVDVNWQYQRDTKNLMAEKIAPIMGNALLEEDETREMGQILLDWDFFDDTNLERGPCLFAAPVKPCVADGTIMTIPLR